VVVVEVVETATAVVVAVAREEEVAMTMTIVIENSEKVGKGVRALEKAVEVVVMMLTTMTIVVRKIAGCHDSSSSSRN
jgi:hypothetical protein